MHECTCLLEKSKVLFSVVVLSEFWNGDKSAMDQISAILIQSSSKNESTTALLSPGTEYSNGESKVSSEEEETFYFGGAGKPHEQNASFLQKPFQFYRNGSFVTTTILRDTMMHGISTTNDIYDDNGDNISLFSGGGGARSTNSATILPTNATVFESVFETEVGDEDFQLSWSTYALVTFFSTLIIITTVGNLLVVLSVCLVKKLRKPQNYLLVSLAVSDLFVAVFVMPFAIATELNGGIWPFSRTVCDLWVSADVLCCTASILNLCGISVDRYRSITKPLDYSAKTTPRRMLAVILVVWLGSACVTLPPVLLLGNVHLDSQKQPFCSLSQNFWYQIYATMASFYVPLCVMVVVYVKILHVVADKKKKQMGWKPAHHHRMSNRQFPLNHKETNRSQASSASLVGQSQQKSKIKIKNSPVSIAENPQTYDLVTYTVVGRKGSGSGGGSSAAQAPLLNNVTTTATATSPSSSTSSSPTRRTSISTMSTLLTIPTPPSTGKHSTTQSGGGGNGCGGSATSSTKRDGILYIPGTTPNHHHQNSNHKNVVVSLDNNKKTLISKTLSPKELGYSKNEKNSLNLHNHHYINTKKRKSVTLITRDKDEESGGGGDGAGAPVTIDHLSNSQNNSDPANGSTSSNKNPRRPSPSSAAGRRVSVTHFFSSHSIHQMKERQKEKLLDRLREHKASATLGIIMLTFIICWLPFFVLALIRPFLTINDIEIPDWMLTLFNWLGYTNSAINPVIYATLNRDFRKPFREILCLRCSTLDDMMRKEFYRQQYGDNRDNSKRRISRSQTEDKVVFDAQTSPTNV